MAKKEPKMLFLLLLYCLSCHQQSTYVKPILQEQQISSLIRESIDEFSSTAGSAVEYGEPGSLVNLYSGKVHSFLSSMQNILDSGEDSEELILSEYNIDMLLNNREVLQAILEHPEYLESVLAVHPDNEPRRIISEIHLIHIIPMPNGQYVLGFSTSSWMVPEAVYFLFGVENGIEENPLIFTAVNGYRLQTVDDKQLRTLNIKDSLAVSGGVYYDYNKENDYFYFLDGKISRAYSSLKYSLVNGQLVLEEQLTGIRQMSESNDFVIVHFVRQANQFTNVSSIECPSPIAFSDVQDGSSLVDACARKELSEE